jgi:hypothetical protein
MHKGNYDTDRTFAMWMDWNDNKILYVVTTTANGTDGEYGFSTSPVPLNQWVHVACVKAGNQLQLYLNGNLDSSITLAGTSVNNNGPVYFGKSPWYEGVDCDMDDLRIYSRALGAGEVGSLATGVFSPRDTYWFGMPDYLADTNGALAAWEMEYFGHLGLDPNASDDGLGYNLLYDYQHNIDPNVISFTMRLGSQHFNTTNATGTFVVLGGVPSYEAVLVNDTNFNDAVWTNYDGNVRMPLGSTDGVYQVWLGLKGFAAGAQVTWIGTKVYLDRVAPAVIIINPTNGTVAVPYIQLQGCSPETLQRVTFDLSNALAVVTN